MLKIMFKQIKLPDCYICIKGRCMYISRINRALFSLLCGVAILLGSTGFVMQTHECKYNGSRVYVLAGHTKEVNRCCDHDDLRCCESETEHSPGLCVNPDSLRSEPCCKHEVGVVQLPGFTLSDKNIERDIPLIAELLTFLHVPKIKSTDISIYGSFHNKYGGKDILILNCQSLT
jgi:hypothetical protein